MMVGIKLESGKVVAINGLDGYTLPELKQRLEYASPQGNKQEQLNQQWNSSTENIMQYAERHSQEESKLLKELHKETHQKVLQSRMISGHLQGRLLSFLSQLIQPKIILELGTYTGYATLCLAEGLVEKGEIHTIEINEELIDFCKKYFDKSAYKSQIICHQGDAKKDHP